MNSNHHLSRLIQTGKNKEAKKIIEESNLYNEVDVYKCKLLHYAAQYNNLKMTKYLLEKGCDIDAQDALGYTPLMEALEGQRIEVSETLLEAGASVIITNNAEESPMKFFFEKWSPTPPSLIIERLLQPIFRRLRQQCPENEKAAEKLIDDGCQTDQAVCLKDAKLLKCMLQKGLSANYVRTSEEFKSEDPRHTPLHLAVKLNDLEMVKVLVEYGANVNALNSRDRAPIYYLYYSWNKRKDSNEIKILRVLLRAGALPMSICMSCGHFQCYYTLVNGPMEAIRLLIKSDLDFEATDFPKGNTILIYLAKINRPEIVEVLKSHSITFDVNVANQNGMTALDLAASNANVSMIQFLLDRGAKVNLIGNGSAPTLFCAFSSFNRSNSEASVTECIEILLQQKIDPQIFVNVSGEQFTIFDIVIEKNKNERLKPAVAHIALLYKLGIPITELIYSKINSRLAWKKYFQCCKGILDQKIGGNVTLFMLLTANKKKIAKYLNNQELVDNMTFLGKNKQLAAALSYYKNTIMKLFSKGMEYKLLKHKAAEAIFKYSNGRFAENSIVSERLIDFYLAEQDLQLLSQL